MIKVNLLKNRGTGATNSAQVDFQTSFDTNFESTGMTGTSGQSPLVKFVVILSLPFLMYIYEYYTIESLKSDSAVESQKVMALRAEVDRDKPEAEKAKKMADEIKSLEGRIGKIKSLAKDRLREIRIIDYIQNVIPERVWLNSLRIDAGKVNFQGASLADDQLNKFIDSLESKNYFKSVIMQRSVVQQSKEGTVKSFDLSSEIGTAE